MLPKSEITNETENPKVEDYITVGQEIKVLVKRFAPVEHRLSLSMKDVSGSSYGAGKNDHNEMEPVNKS